MMPTYSSQPFTILHTRSEHSRCARYYSLFLVISILTFSFSFFFQKYNLSPPTLQVLMSLHPYLVTRLGHGFIARLEMRIGSEKRRMRKRIWQYDRQLAKNDSSTSPTARARLLALRQRAHNACHVLERRKQHLIKRLHKVAIAFKCLFKQVVVPDFRPSSFKVITKAITQSLGALHHKV